MEKKFGRYYYLRQDIDTKAQPGQAIYQKLKQIKRIMDKKVVSVKDYDGVKLICEDESWLMFRGSGTEPIMRLYAESTNLAKSQKLLAIGREILKI
jgi:phosphomannomutase